MQKTIHYTSSSELVRAASTYIRRTSLFLRIGLIFVAVVAMATYLLCADQLGTVVGWILIGVSLYASVTFIYFQAALNANSREPDYGPIERQMTFTDDGFGHEDAVPVDFVPWTDVTHVRRTEVYWALHYNRDGRETFRVIPADAVDSELSAMILEHAPLASNTE
jgi:hypothetical protein